MSNKNRNQLVRISQDTYNGSTKKSNFNNSFASDQSIVDISIAFLVPGIINSKLTGIIISKGEPRQFTNKKDLTERYVINMTIRDSPYDFINLSCWGQHTFIENLSSNFHIGDIVELKNLMVQEKAPNGKDDNFKPSTSSLYALSLNDQKGSIEIKNDESDLYNELKKLAHIPIKESNDYYTVYDITINGYNLVENYISILAVVKQVGLVTSFISKAGRSIKKCEVKLFDDTGNDLILILWDEELIKIAAKWIPKEIVIFGSDVKVTFDTFKKKIIVMSTSKTVITVNPNIRESFLLSRFAQTVEFPETPSTCFGGSMFEFSVDKHVLNSVNQSMTVMELKNYMKDWYNAKNLVCTLSAVLTCFNIDFSDSLIIANRCSICFRQAAKDSKLCKNVECLSNVNASSLEESKFKSFNEFYNIRMDFSDATGTLSNCCLVSEVAEQILQMPVEEFKKISEQTKTNIKWKYLLEKCIVIIQIGSNENTNVKPYVKVLSYEKADTEAALRKYIEI